VPTQLREAPPAERLPLGGFAAKLKSPTIIPTEVRINATNTRGVKKPVSEVNFLFIMAGIG
jgi:hypothetical protein